MTTANPTPDRPDSIDSIRAAARQHEQAARRHRHGQRLGALLLIAGAGASYAALTPAVPRLVGVAGLALLAVGGLLLVILRPGEQAEAHDETARRLHRVLDVAPGLDTEALRTALAADRGEAALQRTPPAPGLAVPHAGNGG